ncbi:MAG: 4Fe-4S binding protein, partial [Bacteroidota bacterium]
MKLSDVLNEKRCFKLVCGAGNEDVKEVEKLVAVYAKAGANYFDLSAKEEVVKAAQRGINRVIPKNLQNKYSLNVSVGITGDPHIRKAFIDKEKCQSCGECELVCPQKSIKHENDYYFVTEERCIGCGECEKICPADAITFTSKQKDLNEVLPPLISSGLNSIELHAVTDNEEKAYEQWLIIQKHYNGILSLCLDRSHLSDTELIRRIKRFISTREKYTTIIQCDGAPMSGGSDDYNTTLQAIATADIVQKEKLPVWLLLSGGTNSK